MAKAGQKQYCLFAHSSDIGIEAYGADEKEMFANALLALSDIVAEPKEALEKEAIIIVVEGDGLADLLVNFMREGLFWLNARRFVVRRCEIVSFSDNHVHAVAHGEALGLDKIFKREIKAITYHQSAVGKTATWLVYGRVVVDV